MQLDHLYLNLINTQDHQQKLTIKNILFTHSIKDGPYWTIEYIENATRKKDIIQHTCLTHYLQKKKLTIPTFMDGTLYITTAKNNQIIHIGNTYYQKNIDQTWLSITQHRNHKYQYNITDIWTKTPTELTKWIQQHIPTNQIIAHYAPYGEDPNNQLFYHDKISKDTPCAHIGISWPNIENEEGIIDYAIQPIDKDHPLILTLHQMCYIDSEKMPDYSKKLNNLTTNNDHDIPAIMHYLEHVFLQQENMLALSQHQRMQLYRTIIKHGKDIAQDIYSQIMEYYQHRAHPPTLTFPPLTQKTKDSPP